MRKLILQVQISIDGFIADTDGNTDWLVWKNWDADWNWDDTLKKYFNEIIDTVDCILLSRNVAKGGFISHWTMAATKQSDPRFSYAKKINSLHKIVFSKTLEKSEWPNTEIASGDLATEVNNLKKQKGRDIIVYGGATFVSSLVKARLIDEFQLFINPTVLGSGMPIFKEIDNRQNLSLIKSKSFDCGIAVLTYQAK